MNAEEPPSERHLFVLMGVSGSGKTSVGREVASRCHAPFLEGDDYHPRANVEKMSAGIPLTDADRVPWIAAIAVAVNECPANDVVLACSALTNAVRNKLRAEVQRECVFIHLKANPEIIRERLKKRTGHYMRSHMLDSQLAALEAAEHAIEVDASRPLNVVVDEVARIVCPDE
jgi:carbohydrate kinase (thermoresistant glucokinase family)